jgi:hypothetical protein
MTTQQAAMVRTARAVLDNTEDDDGFGPVHSGLPPGKPLNDCQMFTGLGVFGAKGAVASKYPIRDGEDGDLSETSSEDSESRKRNALHDAQQDLLEKRHKKSQQVDKLWLEVQQAIEKYVAAKIDLQAT